MFESLIKKITNFKIVIYARLSKEEKDKQTKKEQSQSISNQIQICREYIEEEKRQYPNCIFNVVEELYDDGISGTTFDRQNFNKLIKLINNKKVNMVITKDLSRLGRDHVEADNYIEKWFPEHNVRYVSILDGIDTFTENINNDMAPILNWMNDKFAKDTSKKIKTTFNVKRKQGKWTGGEPPIGYKINPSDKGSLIIDPPAAIIVKKIFNLAKKNNSIDSISKQLMKEKIPIPTVIKGTKRKINNDLIEIWSSETIRNILQNEMYLGHMIQGKTAKLSYKSKKIIQLPKEDWLKIENTHEAIIDKQTFDTVQLLIKSNRNKTIKTYDYLLKGLMRCKECNHSISIQHFKERKNNYTICNYYRKYGSKKNVCTAHRFHYEQIEKIVLKVIKDECLKYVDIKKLSSKLRCKCNSNNEYDNIKNQMDKINMEIRKLNKQIDNIYNDKLEGIITLEQYQRFLKIKQDRINFEVNTINDLKKRLSKMRIKDNKNINYEKIINSFFNIEKISRTLIVKLIDIIYINEMGDLEIYYRVKKPK